VTEDIRRQVISYEKAAAALAQDRIDDCLEECAWVLSRMRHHQLFLKLKQKAEERELALVDEYSNAVAGIRELLAAGEVGKAEKLCAEASFDFAADRPQYLSPASRTADPGRSRSAMFSASSADSPLSRTTERA
jgi:hypothetical protein